MFWKLTVAWLLPIAVVTANTFNKLVTPLPGLGERFPLPTKRQGHKHHLSALEGDVHFVAGLAQGTA